MPLNQCRIIGIIVVERGDKMGRIWMERLLRWQAKFQQMMRGRYGHFDQLNRVFLCVSVAGMVLNIFLNLAVLRIITWLILILAYYRFFSKKIYLRSNENTKYLKLKNNVVNRFTKTKNKFDNRHTYQYFACPTCKQELRAPKGKGKIKVTCVKCQSQFVKKV